MATFPEVLTTDRLKLRRITHDDAPNMFAYASNPEVARFMSFPTSKSIDEIITYIDSIQEPINTNQQMGWAIEEAGKPGLIGTIDARRNHGLEIGYVLNPNFWGRGYMPEALKAVIKWGFEVDGVHRIWATCAPENENSAKVMQKASMTDEGILRRWAMFPNLSDEPMDHRILSIVR